SKQVEPEAPSRPPAEEIVVPRDGRPDAGRTVVDADVLADAEDSSDGAVGEDVAGGQIGLRHQVDGPIAEVQLHGLPLDVIGQDSAGLVADLVEPALSLRLLENEVNSVLGLPAECRRSHHAELELQTLEESPVVLLEETQHAIQPGPVGPVVGVGNLVVQIGGGEEALAESQRGSADALAV